MWCILACKLLVLAHAYCGLLAAHVRLHLQLSRLNFRFLHNPYTNYGGVADMIDVDCLESCCT